MWLSYLANIALSPSLSQFWYDFHLAALTDESAFCFGQDVTAFGAEHTISRVLLKYQNDDDRYVTRRRVVYERLSSEARRWAARISRRDAHDYTAGTIRQISPNDSRQECN